MLRNLPSNIIILCFGIFLNLSIFDFMIATFTFFANEWFSCDILTHLCIYIIDECATFKILNKYVFIQYLSSAHMGFIRTYKTLKM